MFIVFARPARAKEVTAFDALAQGKVKVTGLVADLILIEKYLV